MNMSESKPADCAELRNFTYLPAGDLAQLAAEYGLALPARTLALCQDLYRATMYRNPTAAELRFFDGILRRWRHMPGGVRVTGLSEADAESTLVWQDICQKSTELAKTMPPSLPDLAELCGSALSRAGIRAKNPGFFVGSGADLAARCNGQAPELALDLGTTAAVLTGKGLAEAAPDAMLFLFSPAPENAAAEVASFLAKHRSMNLVPVAFVRDEGMLVHLAALRTGLDVDYTLLPGYTLETGPSMLLDAGKNTLLFFAPRRAAQDLQNENIPGLLLFGSRTGSQHLVLRAGTQAALPLPFSFLSALRVSVAKTLKPKAFPGGRSEVQIKAAGGKVLAGVSAGCNTLDAMLDAVTALAEAGAVISTAQFSTVLEFPGSSDCAFEEALPLLFGVHRAAAELVLPSANHRQLQRDALEHPLLSVFLLADTGKDPSPEEIASIRSAAKAHDFAALRELFFGKK